MLMVNSKKKMKRLANEPTDTDSSVGMTRGKGERGLGGSGQRGGNGDTCNSVDNKNKV